MSQIVKKFIANDAVDDAKVLLLSQGWLRSLNSGAVPQNILRLNASDIIEFASLPRSSGLPLASNDLATKGYVDSLLQGFKWKNSVHAASTANVALSGVAPLTVDGVSIVDGSRLLLKDQTDARQNGIYTASVVGATYSLTRALDMDVSLEFPQAAVGVEGGTTNDNALWLCTNDNPPVLGTDSITFLKVLTLADLVAGLGIQKVSNTLNVLVDGQTTLINGSNQVAVKLDPTGAIVSGASGIRVKVEASNPSLAIDGSNQLKVNYGALTAGLTQDSAGLKVRVDAGADLTTKINSSTGELITPVQRQFAKTLVAADITNGYVALPQLAQQNSVDVYVSGVWQRPGLDFTLSTVASVTRVTFAGDLTDSSKSALVVGDTVYVDYRSY